MWVTASTHTAVDILPHKAVNLVSACCVLASILLIPRHLRWFIHSTTAPSDVAAGVTLPAALLLRVQHTVCALLGLMRDPVSWHHWILYPVVTLIWLPPGCLILFCKISLSSASVRTLLSQFGFRSARPLNQWEQWSLWYAHCMS